MTVHADTIFALATPTGRSGVAVVRVSGPATRGALAALGVSPLPAPRVAALKTLAFDQALVLWFPNPNSFTGEDVAELHLHGSRAVIQAALKALAAVPGLRLAQPGEFTRRAFLNGRMDLTEAEGLADLIDAETDAQRTQALRQMQGALGTAYAELREAIIRPLAHLEAYIDFPEEDIPGALLKTIQAEVDDVRARIGKILGSGNYGERLREGFSVVILGAPNVGKSSLLNALAKRDAAIVSHVAGTTRDVIEVHLNIAGLPVVMVDTAGIRDSADPIEQEGIRRALARAEHADVKLVLLETAPDAATLKLIDPQAIVVRTKADLGGTTTHGALPVSTLSGAGLDALMETIANRLSASASGEMPLITRARHRTSLEAANAQLARVSAVRLLELNCEDLRRAAVEIGKITGKIHVDELLDRVFSEFCIGK